MRVVTVMTLALALLSVGLHAQEPPQIPTPPGATLITEINLSETDVLGMIKQAIPAFTEAAAGAPGEVGMVLKNVDLNLLVDAIRDVKQIRVVQFKVAPKSDVTKMLGFFEESLPTADGWSRVLYDASMIKKGAVAIYTRSGQDFFGVAVDPTTNRVFVARTVGFVDVPKLAAWAGKVAKFSAEMEAKQKAAAAKAAKPAKKAPAKKKTPTKTRTRKR